MPITPLPTPPSTSDPSTFAARADAHVLALQTWTTEVNALAVTVDADKTTATTKAAEASASATAAAASSTTAAASETNAAAAKVLAESARDSALAIYDSFDDRYLGAKTADPTVDNDGNALLEGALYFNSVSNVMRVYNGAAWQSTNLTAFADAMYFRKPSMLAHCFTKTGASTLSVLAGTEVTVNGVLVSFSANTAITMPSLTGGNDYAIYVCDDGTIRADASFTAPAGYTVNNSRQIGGFHYGLVAAGTTVAGGSFATTGNGMIWTQADVDNIAGINKFSLWDLKFRPTCSNPRGMALVGNRTWVDIYLCNTDTDTNGTSKAGSNIASSTVLPKKPAAFGGNGTVTYATPTWWDFNEIARSQSKRMIFESEFVEAAFGVTENQSIDATASTYPTTQRNAGYTSKYGIEQASGHHWTWGADSGGTTSSAYIANGGRGQSYANGLIRVILGGTRTFGALSGSRSSNWGNGPASVYWSFGLRAASDHLISV